MAKRKPVTEFPHVPIKKAPPDKPNPVDIRKALTLRLHNKMSYGQIAVHLGCSRSSAHAALKPFENMLKHPEVVNAYQENKAELLTAAEFEMLSSLLDKDAIKKASLNNRAYTYGQIAKEAHLARGEATANINFHALLHNISEIDQDIAKLEEQLDQA